MADVTLHSPVLGLKPYVVIEYQADKEEPGAIKANIQFGGGIDSQEELSAALLLVLNELEPAAKDAELARTAAALTPDDPALPNQQVITWDWKEQVPLDRLAAVVREVSGGRVHLHPVDDTGGDEYALVVSARQLDDAEITAAYQEVSGG